MTIGRPLQFNPDQALDAAMQVFWKQGYEATSLQALLVATRLSKSSLYQTFGNKHALFEKSIEHYKREMIHEMQTMLESATSGLEFIRLLFLKVAEDVQGNQPLRGCLVMNTASEFAQTDPAIAALVKQSIQAFKSVFSAAIKRAQSEGDIPADKDPELLATFVMTSLSGIKTQVKAGVSADEVKRVSDIVLSALT